MMSYKEYLTESLLKAPKELIDSVMKFILQDLGEEVKGKKNKFFTQESDKLINSDSINISKMENTYVCFWYPEKSSLIQNTKRKLDERIIFYISLNKTYNEKYAGFYFKENNMIVYFVNNSNTRNFFINRNIDEQDKISFMFQMKKTLQHEITHLIDVALKQGKTSTQIKTLEDYLISPEEYETQILDHVEDFMLAFENDVTPKNVNEYIKFYINKFGFFSLYKRHDYEKFKGAYGKFYGEVMKRLEEVNIKDKYK